VEGEEAKIHIVCLIYFLQSKELRPTVGTHKGDLLKA